MLLTRLVRRRAAGGGCAPARPRRGRPRCAGPIVLLAGLALLAATAPARAGDTGACCLPKGCKPLTEAECLAAGGSYQGDGVACPKVDCTLGACCLDGACALETAPICAAAGGEYQGDGTGCDAAECSIGACCLVVGCSEQFTENGCLINGGTFFEGAACSICGGGACCFADATCLEADDEAGCAGLGGDFQGQGIRCGQVTCAGFGACCLDDGSCVPAEALACDADLGGTYQGDASLCAAVTCPAPGACCLPEGCCAGPVLETACAGLSGAFQGEGTRCTGAGCDVLPPVLECPGPQEVPVDAFCAAAVPDLLPLVGASDDCTAPESLVLGQVPAPGAPLALNQPQVVLVTATDADGNTGQCEITVTAADVTAPQLSLPLDVTVACGADTSPASTGVATATDACDPAPHVTWSDAEVEGPCPQAHLITRTWTATDLAGNAASGEQAITVADAVAPALTVPRDVEIECGGDSSPAVTGEATAVDDCDGAPVVSFADEVEPGRCPVGQVIMRTWTATDACENQTSAVQVITALDTAPPVVEWFPEDVTLECGPLPPPEETGIPVAVDTCGGTVIVDPLDMPGFGCGLTMTISRLWIMADECGNTETGVQMIVLVDTLPPAFDEFPADVAVECGGDTSPEATGMPVASDGCGGVMVSFSDRTSPTCLPGELIMRTWTAVDQCGNETSAVQLVEVVDSEPPQLFVPPDVIIQCTEDRNPRGGAGYASALDNCDPGPLVSFDDEVTPGPCPQALTIVRTWAATDTCGNSTEIDQLILVVDTVAPAVTACPEAISVEIDAAACAADVTWPLPLAQDACDDGPAVEFEIDEHDDGRVDGVVAAPAWTFPLGVHRVIVRAADACDNVNSSCQFTVEVLSPHEDCDGNGRPDPCDLADGAEDCNGNGRPDACDVADGASDDDDGNGIPDECQVSCCDQGLPRVLRLRYAPAGCEASSHGQGKGAVQCDDFGPLPATAWIVASDQPDPAAPDADVWFAGEVAAGAAFDLEAVSAGRVVLGPVTFVHVLEAPEGPVHQSVSFVTSCAEPLAVGDRYGAALVLGCTGADEGSCCSDGAIRALIMTWTAEPCPASRHAQGPGAVTCEDFEPLPATAYMIATDTEDPDAPGAAVWFSGDVTAGGLLALNAAAAGRPSLGAATWLHVLAAPGGAALQRVRFDTSCAEPLYAGWQFGSGLVEGCIGVDEPVEPDCNGNGLPDDLDVLVGASPDRNGNGVPDECDCLADLDLDGAVDVADLVALVLAWGVCQGPCPADLDGNGEVDVEDLILLIQSWGECEG